MMAGERVPVRQPGKADPGDQKKAGSRLQGKFDYVKNQPIGSGDKPRDLKKHPHPG
jgi:hypothetical protein